MKRAISMGCTACTLSFLIGAWVGYQVTPAPVYKAPKGEYVGYTALDADNVVRTYIVRDTVAYDRSPLRWKSE